MASEAFCPVLWALEGRSPRGPRPGWARSRRPPSLAASLWTSVPPGQWARPHLMQLTTFEGQA